MKVISPDEKKDLVLDRRGEHDGIEEKEQSTAKDDCYGGKTREKGKRNPIRGGTEELFSG